MRTKIVRIGNSQGVRISREVLADAGLLDDAGAPVEVDMSVTNEGIVIKAAGELGPVEAFLEFASRFREETGGVDLNDYGPLRDGGERPNPLQWALDEAHEEADGGQEHPEA
jgi:antitoxin component of MazEF toxin-antitoxin module